MATRKASTKTPTIDPVALISAALKAVKAAADCHRIRNTTEPDIFEAAWNQLSASTIWTRSPLCHLQK